MKRLLDFFKNKISDGEIELVEDYIVKGCVENQFIPSVHYKIRLNKEKVLVGRCDLRVGMNPDLYYAGNIGYHIKTKYRGHHYAEKASRLLFKLAKEKYLMDELIITCSPENIASRKTCEKLKGVMEGIVEVPKGHWLIEQQEDKKCIFRYNLKEKGYEANH